LAKNPGVIDDALFDPLPLLAIRFSAPEAETDYAAAERVSSYAVRAGADSGRFLAGANQLGGEVVAVERLRRADSGTSSRSTKRSGAAAVVAIPRSICDLDAVTPAIQVLD
jgi:hypothetical protein